MEFGGSKRILVGYSLFWNNNIDVDGTISSRRGWGKGCFEIFWIEAKAFGGVLGRGKDVQNSI